MFDHQRDLRGHFNSTRCRVCEGPSPSCAADWEGISREFERRWNFPNCVGMLTPNPQHTGTL